MRNVKENKTKRVRVRVRGRVRVARGGNTKTVKKKQSIAT